MITKEALEKLLEVNGLTVNDPEEHVKELFLRARWTGDDVETAIAVLRENKNTADTKISLIQNSFRAGDRLDPTSITSMLGVDTSIPIERITARAYKRSHVKEGLMIVLVSVCTAAIFLLMLAPQFSQLLW